MYGGTERVVSYLTEELVRLGHDVTLFASGDSLTAARLRAPCERATRLDTTCQDPLARHILMLGAVYERADEFDIIHSHVDYLCLPLARLSRVPTVLTLHGRLDMPELPALYNTYSDVPLVSISDAQRTPLPKANWVATIHHGLPDLYRYVPERGRYLLFLGRISPEKCPDTAIRVARRTGIPLRIAAKVDPVDQKYFETLRPLFDDPLVEMVGEVGEDGKQELLGGALALLFPIDWPEPFGLVMIESLACGTPVIARPRGSVAEVIQNGETGWICETEDEMVDAVRRLDQIDRATCRAAFERQFTVETMARHYLDVYDAVRVARRVPRAQPAASDALLDADDLNVRHEAASLEPSS